MNQRHTLTIKQDLFDVLKNRALINRRSVNQEILYLVECAMVMEVPKDLEVRRLARLASADPTFGRIETDEP